VLKCAELNVRIDGAEILRNVSMHVPENAFVALVGRNGAGKTTLMRSIMNLIPIHAGTIQIGGRDTTHAQPHSHAGRGVGYMPEDRRLIADWTVEKNILLPIWASRRPDYKERLAAIYDLIPEVRDFSQRKALQLSGGQQKLVALARAFMVSENLLILDEPFEGVAPALVQRLIEILLDFRKRDSFSVFISESDVKYSAGLVDSIYVIERGEIQKEGAPPLDGIN
jgi:branched-chain amino acid transport system ATP-binding protein